MAALSKPMAISAAPALLLYDWLIVRRRWSESLRALWPHVLLCSLLLGLSIWTQDHASSIRTTADTRWGSLDRAGTTILIDLLRSFVPVPFSPFYPQQIIEQISPLVRWGALCLLVGLSAGSLLVVRKSDRWRPAVYFWWLAVLFLVPVSGILPLGSTSLADRYLLVPSIGPCLLIGWCLSHVRRPALAVGAYAAIGLLAVVFHLRAAHWSNSVYLWQSVVERYPESPLGWKNLTSAFFQRGDLPRAAESALTGVKHLPGETSLTRNAVEVLLPLGRLDEAEDLISKARRHNGDASVLDLLSAKLALRRGDPQRAHDVLVQLLDRHPDQAEAWNVVSYAYEQLGDLAKATTAAEQAIQREPEEAEYHRRLLSLQQSQQQLEQMVITAERANEHLPHFLEAWQVRIAVLRQLQREVESDLVARQAARYVPLDEHNAFRLP